MYVSLLPDNKTLLLLSGYSDPVPWSSASSELSVRLWFRTGDHKLEFYNSDLKPSVIRHGGYVCKGAQEFLSKEILNYISNWLGPQHLCTSPIHTWNSGTSSWRSLYLFCHPHKEDSSHDQLWGWWECHLLRCDQRQEKTENQSAECGVVLLCSLFWSPENNLFHVGYCLSPILNSILGFEEEESKDGYHWLTSEFY